MFPLARYSNFNPSKTSISSTTQSILPIHYNINLIYLNLLSYNNLLKVKEIKLLKEINQHPNKYYLSLRKDKHVVLWTIITQTNLKLKRKRIKIIFIISFNPHLYQLILINAHQVEVIALLFSLIKILHQMLPSLKIINPTIIALLSLNQNLPLLPLQFKKIWRGYRVRKILQQYTKDQPKPFESCLNDQHSLRKDDKKQSTKMIKFHAQFIKLKATPSKMSGSSYASNQNLLKYIDTFDFKNSSNISSIKSNKHNIIFNQSIEKLSNNPSEKNSNLQSYKKSSNASLKSSPSIDNCFKRQKPILPGVGIQIEFQPTKFKQESYDYSQFSQPIHSFQNLNNQLTNNSIQKTNSNDFQTILQTNEQNITSYKNSLTISKKKSQQLINFNDKQNIKPKLNKILKSQFFQIRKINQLQIVIGQKEIDNQQYNIGFQIIQQKVENYLKKSKNILKQKLTNLEISLQQHIAKSKLIRKISQLFAKNLKTLQQEYFILKTKISKIIEQKQDYQNFSLQQKQIESFNVKIPQSEYFILQLPKLQQNMRKNNNNQNKQNFGSNYSNFGIEQLKLYISNIIKQMNEQTQFNSQLQFLCHLLKQCTQKGTNSMIQRCLIQFLVQIIANQHSTQQVLQVINQKYFNNQLIINQRKQENILQQMKINKNKQIQLIIQKWSKQLNKWQMEVIDQVQMDSSSFLTDFNDISSDITKK